MTDSIESLLGFKAINPNFPDIPITVEMILSHQSSLVECDVYNTFLVDSYNAQTGYDVPLLSALFTKGSKYYDACTFSKTRTPGTYFDYVNLNFVIAGTIIEVLSGLRFDLYMRERFLSKFSA
jgi:D-alanyl-D-alanine carboxypeptidase